MKVRDWNIGIAVCILGVFGTIGSTVDAASIEENILAIKAVGPEGAKHSAAIAAVKELSKASAESLPVVLKSFEGANPLAVNWLRSVVDSIADRTLRQ